MRPHFLYRQPRRRAELYAVLDASFAGLAHKVDAARALGFDWDAVTTPFVEQRDDRVVAHVGVLDVPLRLRGRAVRVAGIHAVCTLPTYRRQGCFRAAMEQALRFVDSRWELAQLSTHEPGLYEPFGFRVVPTVRWEAPRPDAPRAPIAAPIDLEADLLALGDALSRRTPLSNLYAAMDDGWLFGIDAVLGAGDLSYVRRIPELDVFIAGQLHDERFTLHDVVGRMLPSWPQLCAHLPGTGPVALTFTPDRFESAEARVVGASDDGCYMVRGHLELDGRPLSIPRLAQH